MVQEEVVIKGAGGNGREEREKGERRDGGRGRRMKNRTKR